MRNTKKNQNNNLVDINENEVIEVEAEIIDKEE